MYITVDLCLIPIDCGLSLSPYIAECEKILLQRNLTIQLHAFGTNIEGEWDQVFAAIKECHEKVHSMGAQRINTSIKLGSRTDKKQSLHEKVESVKSKL